MKRIDKNMKEQDYNKKKKTMHSLPRMNHLEKI